MRTLRLSLLGMLILALPGGTGGAVLAQEESESTAFPTGLFVSVENPYLTLEFHEDGTGISHNREGGWLHHFTFAVDGAVYTWLSADWQWEPYGQPTKTWAFDGERLTFEPLSEDPYGYRDWVYADNTFELVEDPVEVVVAVQDIPAGSIVYATWAAPRIVAAERVGPDAFTDFMDVIGAIAAVDIAKGQPITPDMLEPSAD